MTSDEFETLCQNLPGATCDVQWGEDRVFKVAGKMFAVLGPRGSCSFKANDVAFEMLTQTGAAKPAPYLARAKWVYLDSTGDLPDSDLRTYLEEAHRLITGKLTRKARQALGLA